jgi:beta-galactosidase GanA
MNHTCIFRWILAALLLFGRSSARGQRSEVGNELPAIVARPGGSYSLLVDGKPFIILGTQLWNSSAWPYLLDSIWPLVKQLHANTVEAPVYWQVTEPVRGTYSFGEVDSLIDGARRAGVRLVLLWFGSFKNGSSGYVPDWMMSQPQQYPRMENLAGEKLPILSVLSPANLEADETAFAALMRHLKAYDSRRHTVILVQVENECGSLGTDRDYSAAANTAFAQPVPDSLCRRLGKQSGGWTEVFGKNAAEAFQAFCFAHYVNEIAGAGRREYPLPMYANNWLNEYGFRRAGEYPSGGPAAGVLDIWKAVTPQLSLLAPDIYLTNEEQFKEVCGQFHRPDNPFFIPEMGRGVPFARFQWYAIGNYQAFGVAPYGIDPFGLDPGDRRNPDMLDATFSLYADNYRLLQGALDTIAGLQGTGRLKAAGEAPGLGDEMLAFDGYDLLLNYGYPRNPVDGNHTGRVLAAQLDANTFLLLGFDAQFRFLPTQGSGYRVAEIEAIEEGRFEGRQWVRQRIWNGDEAYFSVFPHEGAILRVRLHRMQ